MGQRLLITKRTVGESVVSNYLHRSLQLVSAYSRVIPRNFAQPQNSIKVLASTWSVLEEKPLGTDPCYKPSANVSFHPLNVGIPYFYEFLTSRQGLVSYSEEETSLVSKNFFYIFVNLFLVFTLAGTASNYWGYLSDTTKIAYQLATSVKEFSLFYTDLIILQGVGMFPFKLLLAGSLIGFPLRLDFAVEIKLS